MKKRPFTLFEVTAVLFLAGVLFATVLRFFHDYAQTERKIKTLKSTTLTRASLQLRLGQLLSSERGVHTEIYPEINALALFITKEEEKSIVYLNQNKELVLLCNQDKELLYSHLKSAKFQFFDGKEWLDKWEEKTVPLILTLTLIEKSSKEPTKFSFFFPSDKPITYERKI